MPVSSSKRIFQLGELGWAQTSTDSGCVKDLGALSHTLGVWNCSTRVCPWPQLDLTLPGRIPRSLDWVGWVPTYRLKGFCASHLCLRLGSSLILEANLPLISVANIHQAGLAAAVATAKDSVLSCAVIRSLIKYSLNIPSSPFLKQGWSHSPFGRAVLGGLSDNGSAVAGKGDGESFPCLPTQLWVLLCKSHHKQGLDLFLTAVKSSVASSQHCYGTRKGDKNVHRLQRTFSRCEWAPAVSEVQSQRLSQYIVFNFVQFPSHFLQW